MEFTEEQLEMLALAGLQALHERDDYGHGTFYAQRTQALKEACDIICNEINRLDEEKDKGESK
jgi:hypothetical protein